MVNSAQHARLPTTTSSIPTPGAAPTDSAGNIYIAAPGGDRVFVVDAAGKIRVVAGSGVEAFNGNGGSAKTASLNMGVNNLPSGVAVDRNGNIFFDDKFNNQIRRVDAATGVITTFAGSGPGGYSSGAYGGDGGPATSASLNLPGEIAFDTNGNLFIADSQNGRIRRVDASTGMITTVAGNGGFCFAGDGGPAAAAALWFPIGVRVDARGNLFIADFYNNRVRRVDASTGIITTFAGNGQSSFSGDGGPATGAGMTPVGVAIDASGNLVI